jgi:hypothetical protein
LPQDAALDELRLKDVPTGAEVEPGQRLDPLLHYAGRTQVRFTNGETSVKQVNASRFIDHGAQTVSSSTGELKLDYGRGLLTINAPAAQGISGMLRSVGAVETGDLAIKSDMELGHIVAVALDGKPLRTSGKMLLQVMSEEKPSGFQTEPAGADLKRIVNLGTDPWLIKKLEGKVRFLRPDAGDLKVTVLDLNGYPLQQLGIGSEITLRPESLYYLIER